jgi:hypothetical protein
MTDTTPTQSPEPTPKPTVGDVLRDPSLLASRREELVQLVTQRAQKVAATARTGLESARTDVAARVQDLRKASDTFVAASRERLRGSSQTVTMRVRTVLHERLERAAAALQAAAKKVEPRAEPPRTEQMPPPQAHA